jgi:hypothetical protein
MMTQRKVLTFIAKHTEKGRGVTAHDLSGEFWLSLSMDAACGHLKRLWRERLIETTSARPPRFRFRLEPGEPILPLRFRLTARGRERLRWYERRGDDQSGVRLFR